MEEILDKIYRFFRFYFCKTHTTVEVTKKLTDCIGIEVARLFHDKEFRKLLNFNKLDEKEKTAIEYELLLNGYVFGVLFFEYVSTQNESPIDEIFSTLSLELNKGFGNELIKHGAKEEMRDVWNDAIRKRAAEYREFYEKNKDGLPEVVKRKYFWQYVVADRTIDRLRKGKMDSKDPLFEKLIDWTIKTSNKMFETVIKTLK